MEHTADSLVEVHGRDLNERFENAAYAMFDLITDAGRVKPKGEVKIVLSADAREQLLVDFLQELLYLNDAEDLVFGKFEVKTDGRKLEAMAWGEKFDPKRHEKRAVVKGVTYHKLEFDDEKGTLTVLFDV